MSGVGISGLLANLPGTVTPYPTQDPNLELGGYRAVADAAARDAIPANFRVLDMLVTLQSTGVTYQLFGGLLNANWGIYTNAPFKGEYYVNSSFTGPQLGSQSNPFTTVAAAFAFAASVAVTSGVVNLGQNHTENVVFPATGDWELRGTNQSFVAAITLTGTVDITCTATSRRALTNLKVTGTVSGSTTGGASRVRFLNCSLAAVSLTGVAASFWRASFSGQYQPSTVALGGSASGLVSIQGQLTGFLFTFAGGLTLGTVADVNEFSGCSFVGTIATGVTSTTLKFINKCEWNAGQVFTSVGTSIVQFDGSSWAYLNNVSPTFTGTWSIITIRGNRSERSVIANNKAAAALTSVTAGLAGQMTLTATLTLLVPGTLGVAVVSVTYTDLTGVVRTKALGVGLNIAGAAGDEFAASITFVSLGPSIGYDVSGITTPGALSLSVAVNLKTEY